MRKNLTQSIEDYLKAIYELANKETRATTTALADYLNVTPASVTGMIKKLSTTDPPLIQYQKHHGVVLTAAGQNVALETIRHHRLIELFLHQILGYDWDEVHDEADRLEHVISEKFERAISDALGNPRHDPHGDPIPSFDLELPDSNAVVLQTLRPPSKAIVTRVRDNDPDLLRHLQDLGIVPETEIEVVDFSEFDENLHVRLKPNGNTLVLGPKITQHIFVETH